MQVEPLIGLRSKLTTRGTGKWEGSSGDFAKFGLTVPELIHAVPHPQGGGQGALRASSSTSTSARSSPRSAS